MASLAGLLPNGYLGSSQQSAAVRNLFNTASKALSAKTGIKITRKKKRSKTAKAPRKTKTKKASKTLTKGTAAAKKRMAALRKMRKK